MTGAMWSKLLLNCAVTTLGAIAGTTMRDYLAHADCRALFERTYDEALAVALACRVQPERMLVEPIPPRTAAARDAWLAEVVAAYGDLKPSMLHDLERGRPTEIDYINGYVHERGLALGVATPIAAAIVDLVTAMSGGHARPGLDHLRALAARYARG
jgi:2-dehydropantoate 2-reductase